MTRSARFSLRREIPTDSLVRQFSARTETPPRSARRPWARFTYVCKSRPRRRPNTLGPSLSPICTAYTSNLTSAELTSGQLREPRRRDRAWVNRSIDTHVGGFCPKGGSLRCSYARRAACLPTMEYDDRLAPRRGPGEGAAYDLRWRVGRGLPPIFKSSKRQHGEVVAPYTRTGWRFQLGAGWYTPRPNCAGGVGVPASQLSEGTLFDFRRVLHFMN